MNWNFEDLFGPLPAHPTECPDCGSRSILPIRYGFRDAEMAAEAEREEFICGGCCVANPSWHCKDCFNSWPEDPPPDGLNGALEWRKNRLAEAIGEYISLTADATLPPQPDEPRVAKILMRRGSSI
jgi:hypothetical protein